MGEKQANPQPVMTTPPPPRISVVIVNWNRRDDVADCVKSLGAQEEVPFEIIVVDNGSTDGSIELLERLEQVRLLVMGINVGPAKARNVGAHRARGEYLLFLDSDAFLENDALQKLAERMDRESDVGIIGCRILNYHDGKIDQWIYPDPYHTHGHVEFDTYSFSAAAALVRGSAFDRVDGFWEDLFIYNEEVDLSIRIIRAGFRVIYFPEVSARHRVSLDGRAPSTMYFYYQARNWIWIFYRYYPAFRRWRKVLVYANVYMLKGLVSGHPLACIRGLWDGVSRMSIISRYRDKLTATQVAAIESMNRRASVKIGR